MTTQWLPVTYESLNAYNLYRWNSSIGEYGGFEYQKSSDNSECINKPINLNEIGEITECDTTQKYSLLKFINGLSNTTVNLPGVPIGTPYGWSHIDNKWLYYTLSNSDKPTHYATYIMYVD